MTIAIKGSDISRRGVLAGKAMVVCMSRRICVELYDAIVALRPERAIYVSCDVATLARDARRLVDAGYAITRIDGFDLFPNTPHVETVVVFDRSG